MTKAKSSCRKTPEIPQRRACITWPFLAFLSACMPVQPNQMPTPPQKVWQKLFDGETLNNWRVHGGNHEFTVANGIITGTAVKQQPSAFLVTTQSYDDFILEVEFLSDGSLNSGIMFRAGSDPAYRGGRLFGYQAEIDPSPRGWTGGLFEEALRGWLVPMDKNEACRASFRRGNWNTMRIEALGPDLRTFLNGVPCAKIIDSNLTAGVIGLQVHSVPPGKPMGKPGDHISWRNIRILTGDIEGRRMP